ncbi:ubiquitin receptor1 [Zea mays]|nr:ubiquitin receptor1 [Zea mays]
MGWLTKFFRGSTHNISEEQYHSRPAEDTAWNEPSSSPVVTDILSEFNNEDIDRAIALSLSEEEQRKEKAIDKDMHLEEDEQLARAIQESLNVESPPRRNGSANGGTMYHPPRETGNAYQPPRENGSANGGNAYHPLPFMFSSGFRFISICFFQCTDLKAMLQFSMSGNHPYHKTCYKEQFHPKCDVCKQFIPTNMNGLIEYRAHPFWVQKYCPSHEMDGTPRCCSCERMEPRESKYVLLDDGRKLCLECLDSAVMDTNDCQPLYLEIQEFYEGLNMKVEQQVPLLLVERQALNEAMEGEKAGHHHLPETRGLCLSEEQTVSTILRPRMAGNKIMGMITEPYRLTRRCEVTAILILYGLPR